MSHPAASFDEIYHTYQPRMRRYLERLLGPTEAEDVVQEVFAKASRGLASFRGESQLSTWLFRIARNAAWDRLRAASVKSRPSELRGPGADLPVSSRGERRAGPPESTAEALASDERLERQEMNACIRDLIGDLPETYRTVLFLSDLEGRPNREIAEQLGVTLATVKIRLHRARAQLKQKLESHCTFHQDPDRGLACEPKDATRLGDDEP